MYPYSLHEIISGLACKVKPGACWYFIFVSRGSTYADVPIFNVFHFSIEPAIFVAFQDGGRKRAKRSKTIS